MATWTKNQPTGGNTTRRRWSVEDKQSLNNLKYHIAAEGCSDVQYDLARQLLDAPNGDQDQIASNQQAIHWLVQAAQQGHEEAAKLLRKCYDNNCGITSENETEVKACLTMTPGERAARKAARELFQCLANGGEHITPRQLERKMRKIYNMQKKRRNRGNQHSSSDDTSDDSDSQLNNNRHLEGLEPTTANANIHLRNQRKHDSSRFDDSSESRGLITEDNLVAAAINYSAGRLPAVSNALILSVPHPATLDHLPCIHRIVFQPLVFLTLIYHRLINFITSLPTLLTPSVRFALAFLVYWLTSNEHLTIFLPTCFYYTCVCVMIWSTCKMLRTKQDFIDFRIWSGLFLSYGDHNIEADISENRFLKNNMKPYLYFFCSFVASMIIYPFLESDWLPHSELTILFIVFAFTTLYAFMESSGKAFPDWIILISFGINVLAKYPYEMDEVVATSWRFLDLKVPTFSSFVIGNGIEFCLNCRAALYLVIPVMWLQLAKRSNWHGIYTYLIPHCVTLSWLQLCLNASQSATMFGVVRSTLALSGILLFLPLLGVVSLLIPVFIIIDWMGITDSTIRFGTTVVTGLTIIFASCCVIANRRTQKYLTAIQITIFIIGAAVLTLPHMTSNFKDANNYEYIEPFNRKHAAILKPSDVHLTEELNFLNFDRFYTACGPPAWETNNNNRIKAQLLCSHLNGLPILWEGVVTKVKIGRVINFYQEYIGKVLPNWLAEIIRCYFGEKIDELLDCDGENDLNCQEFKRILENSQTLESKCSLQKWNSYEYEITLRMASGLLSKGIYINLHAEERFKNFTSMILAGDNIRFYGTLQNRLVLPDGNREDFILGSDDVQIQLFSVECLVCHNKNILPISIKNKSKTVVNARLRDLRHGVKYFLNVILNPIIIFK